MMEFLEDIEVAIKVLSFHSDWTVIHSLGYILTLKARFRYASPSRDVSLMYVKNYFRVHTDRAMIS